MHYELILILVLIRLYDVENVYSILSSGSGLANFVRNIMLYQVIKVIQIIITIWKHSIA